MRAVHRQREHGASSKRANVVDWALVCDLAYFDGADRLCMFGIDTAGSMAMRTVGSHRLSVALRLRDRHAGEVLDPSVFITSPRGDRLVADRVADVRVEARGDYLLVRLPNLLFTDEGIYRFELTLGRGQFMTFEVAVLVNTLQVLGEQHSGVH